MPLQIGGSGSGKPFIKYNAKADKWFVRGAGGEDVEITRPSFVIDLENIATGWLLFREGQAPDEAEIAHRVERYWRPYHEALQAELQQLHTRHGHAVLFDGHSIQSELPWLFEGRLRDLNLGTADGRSCAPELREALNAVLAAQTRWTHVTDGRFKGGYITRHYGRPGQRVHAVQLEMCFSCYMQESPPWAWNPTRAAAVQPVLRQLLTTARDWRP